MEKEILKNDKNTKKEELTVESDQGLVFVTFVMIFMIIITSTLLFKVINDNKIASSAKIILAEERPLKDTDSFVSVSVGVTNKITRKYKSNQGVKSEDTFVLSDFSKTPERDELSKYINRHDMTNKILLIELGLGMVMCVINLIFLFVPSHKPSISKGEIESNV